MRIQRVIALLLTFSLAAVPVEAGPFLRQFSYHKVTTLNPGRHTLTFSLYTASTGGTRVFTESKTVTLTTNVLEHALGSVNKAGMARVDLSRQLYLEVRRGRATVVRREPFYVAPSSIYSDATGSGGAGDITAVLPGAGLAGGSDTGEATLGLAPAFQLPQSCAANDLAQWGGNSWICGAAPGAGDITAVDTPAGSGLTGGGASGEISLAVLTGPGLSRGPGGVAVNYSGTGSSDTVARGDHDHDAFFWRLGGNTGAGSGNYLGTADDTALNLGANGSVVLSLRPNGTSPNIVGGYSGNTVDATQYGQTIAGGGSFFFENRTQKTFGTVGGGRGNHADAYGTTIAGGIDSQATGDYATVAGGLHNYATGSSAGIGGGLYNVASGYVAYIGGGDLNVASTQNSTIGGGYDNEISGGQLIANGTIGGGVFNVATGFAATIAGGHGNQASGEWSSMGGGGFNEASSRSSTVSGGEYNVAGGPGSTVGGGGWNGASGGNQASATASTIAGGFSNLISADGHYGTIAGGQGNQITAPAGTNLNIATIGGGLNNRVNLGGATVGGGNTNTASGFDATVAGGNGNTASGRAATVPGGNGNLAQGNSSFAAGYRAKAFNHGCFAWADSSNFDFGCLSNNAFAARATGGVYFVTAIDGAGNSTAGVQAVSGSGSWGSLSDRASKENLAAVDARAILDKVARMPISTWNYKTQDDSIRHIGPMAQDFSAAFGVGEDDRHIGTVDADGVALAAIQGLSLIVDEKDARIARLEALVEALSLEVAGLKRESGGTRAATAQMPQ